MATVQPRLVQQRSIMAALYLSTIIGSGNYIYSQSKIPK